MSMTLLTPVLTPPKRWHFTIADLAAMPRSLPSGDVRYELVDGELITMAPPGYDHGRQQNIIGAYLHLQAEAIGLGEACTETGVVLRRHPDRVVAPDAAFVLKSSLPVQRSPEGYLETIPELVVEVRSKNDTIAELVSKCEEYFTAGVHIVWIVDAHHRTIAAHQSDGSVQVFRDGDTLTCPFLPGFGVAVGLVFS